MNRIIGNIYVLSLTDSNIDKKEGTTICMFFCESSDQLSHDAEPRISWTVCNLCLEVTRVRLSLSANLLEPLVFTCQLLVCFINHVIRFWQRRKIS